MFSIKFEILIQSDSTILYRAVTEQDQLQRWFAPQVIISQKINTFGAFAFEFELSFKIKIKKLETNKQVIWEVTEGIYDWINSNISFNIKEKGNSSILYFEHSGLTNTTKKEHWDKSWADFMQKLATYCQNFKS